MKTCNPMLVTAMALFAALAITVHASAQNQTSSFEATAKGEITKFDVKGAGKGSGQGTYPNMNNTEGAITGYYIDPHNTVHGFLRAAGGAIKSFDVPGAGKYNFLGTYPVAINPSGGRHRRDPTRTRTT